jgi:CRISPR-associated protein Cas6
MIHHVYSIKSQNVTLPQDPGYLIFSALCDRLPWLHDHHDIQIEPLDGVRENGSLKLFHDSSLRIRGLTDLQASSIDNLWLSVQDNILLLEKGYKKKIKSSSTLASRLVIFNDFDLIKFLQRLNQNLKGVSCAFSIGKTTRDILVKNKKLVGYSVHLTNLSIEDAEKLLETGIGRCRHFGCGIFQPID